MSTGYARLGPCLPDVLRKCSTSSLSVDSRRVLLESQIVSKAKLWHGVTGGTDVLRSWFSLTCAVLAVHAGCAASAQEQQMLADRPLQFSTIHRDDVCPRSKGNRSVVPQERYIFGSGGVWFGSGPVYLSLSWKDSGSEDAAFSLAPVPREGGVFRAKSPWVAAPSYSGPILIRGLQLRADNGERIAFGEGGRRGLELRLVAPNAPAPEKWSFWPAGFFLTGPGCFGLQIDTLVGTDIIVFEAT